MRPLALGEFHTGKDRSGKSIGDRRAWDKCYDYASGQNHRVVDAYKGNIGTMRRYIVYKVQTCVVKTSDKIKYCERYKGFDKFIPNVLWNIILHNGSHSQHCTTNQT